MLRLDTVTFSMSWIKDAKFGNVFRHWVSVKTMLSLTVVYNLTLYAELAWKNMPIGHQQIQHMTLVEHLKRMQHLAGPGASLYTPSHRFFLPGCIITGDEGAIGVIGIEVRGTGPMNRPNGQQCLAKTIIDSQLAFTCRNGRCELYGKWQWELNWIY